jgi:hypothetical protein
MSYSINIAKARTNVKIFAVGLSPLGVMVKRAWRDRQLVGEAQRGP